LDKEKSNIKFMEILLDKQINKENILSLQEGMRAQSIMRDSPFYARFIWRDDKWWHVLNDPPKSNPVWFKVRIASLQSWTPDLLDPATAGILLARVSTLLDSQARFLGSTLILEDGRVWSKETRLESLQASLEAINITL
jgi:hypothetical protein